MASKHSAPESESLRLKATPTSFSFDVSGGLLTRTGDALLDLISPFTNGAGWLGDKFSHARRNAAIRAASKAAEQLRKEGVLTANIPPKVLLPWLEGASLETDENDSLTDAWAGLFVRAAKSGDAVTISYMETLKKLGKPEAELLRFFAMDTSPIYSERFYGDDDIGIFSERNPLRHRLVEQMEEVLQGKPTVGEFMELMESFGLQGMCQVIFFSVGDARKISTKFFRDHEHVISNLEHLGLISVRPAQFETRAGVVEIIFFEITKYAFDLIWACQGTLTGRHAQIGREANKKPQKEAKNA
jgi:hypothetical protein